MLTVLRVRTRLLMRPLAIAVRTMTHHPTARVHLLMTGIAVTASARVQFSLPMSPSERLIWAMISVGSISILTWREARQLLA